MVWWFPPFSQFPFPFRMQVPMTCPCSSPSVPTLRTSPPSCLSTTTPRPSRTRPASTSPPTRQAARHSTERSSDNTTSRGTSRYIMYNRDFVHAYTCTMVVSLPPSLNLPIIFLQWRPTANISGYTASIHLYVPLSLWNFYMIMPASLVTASFECNKRNREDSYSVMHYTMQSVLYVLYYTND